MAVRMSGNRINVGPNSPAFLVSTNFADHFEIGTEAGDGHWLRGDIVGPNSDFIFNGRLFLPDTNLDSGTIIDNFPKGPDPRGWARHQLPDDNGYVLVDEKTQTKLFGFKVLDDKICLVITNLYGRNGVLIAETTDDQFLIHQGPALIGTGGIRIG